MALNSLINNQNKSMVGGKRNGAGRPKGTPNRTTKEVRQQFENLLDNNIGKLQDLLDKVAEENPTKAIELILKVSEFVIPKLRAVEAPEPQQEPQTLTIRILDGKK
jgi:DNA-binding MurR/RpiR family transcriptional regulator